MKLGVNIDPYLKGIVILVISIGANFIGDTLSCKTRELLDNMYMKHIFSFALLYTTIDLSKGDELTHPSEQFRASIITYIAYLMYTRMNLYFIIVASILAIAIFILNKYLLYWDKKHKGYKNETYRNRKRTKEILEVLLVLTIVLGFLTYFIEKKSEYKDDFSYLKFLFGTNECSKNNDNTLLKYLNKK